MQSHDTTHTRTQFSRLFWFWTLGRLGVEAASYRSQYSYFHDTSNNVNVVDISCFGLRALLSLGVVICEFSAHHSQQQSVVRTLARDATSVNSAEPEESRPLMSGDTGKVYPPKQQPGQYTRHEARRCLRTHKNYTF